MHSAKPSHSLSAVALKLVALLFPVALVILLSEPKAQAVPSYSRQTGLSCATCHYAPPELTPFGRKFKLEGYPIIHFFFLSGYPAVIWAGVISLIAHFAVGAAKSLITIRSWWSSGLEMTFVGVVEGTVTYLIGIVIGRLAGSGV